MTRKKRPSQNDTPSIVTFIEDPLASATLDVLEAQGTDEPLQDLDDQLQDITEQGLSGEQEVDATLERLSGAMTQEAERQVEATEELLASLAGSGEPNDAEALLAEQIKEDELLQAEEARQEALKTESEDGEETAPLLADPRDLGEVQSAIEALIFLSERPASKKRLTELLGDEVPAEILEEALQSLTTQYQDPRHGIELIEVAHGFQFRTKVSKAQAVRKLTKISPHRLSSGAMESLAIIAYKQPVMKEQIDAIRGVDSSHFIRGLLEKGLIQISGRSELPGRPMVYETSEAFLSIFGLKDLSAMPPLPEVEGMVPASQANSEELDPRVRQMRKLVGEMNVDTSVTLLYDPSEDEKILSEIKQRVSSIPTSTATLIQQEEDKKSAALGLTPASQAPEAAPEENTPSQPALVFEPVAEAPEAPLPESQI